MPELNERLLQFIWQHRLLPQSPLKTVSGLDLIILQPGELNRDAGPDFSNARIRLGNLTLAGNIELHLRSSDWLRHGHHHDRAYDRLILHAVYEHDKELSQNNRYGVEVLELKNLIDREWLQRYAQLTDSREQLPCSSQLHHVDDLPFTAWVQRMAVERLKSKTERLHEIFAEAEGDYVQSLYVLLFRSFGFSVNALPFELLARQLPCRLLLRHADNTIQTKALLFGMAGFLEEQLEDKKQRLVQNEFEFLKKKYSLRPLKKELFKRSKMHPANFPEVRLTQIAQLVCRNSRLLLAPQEFDSYEQLFRALSFEANGMGKDAVDTIITNAFAPFFFFFGKNTEQPQYGDLALDLLTACRFESNRKTRLFLAKRSALRNSADSQGLIHLHDTYCLKKACLNCGVGMQLLRKR